MSSEPLDKIRAYVIGEAVAALPATWDVKSGLAPITTISKRTVFVDYKELEPLPEAPIGQALCVMTLAFVSPHEDLAKAEDDADSCVVDLVLAFDAHERIVWRRAAKRAINETYLGWLVEVGVIAATVKTPPETP